MAEQAENTEPLNTEKGRAQTQQAIDLRINIARAYNRKGNPQKGALDLAGLGIEIAEVMDRVKELSPEARQFLEDSRQRVNAVIREISQKE